MFIDFETNHSLALQRSAMYRWPNMPNHTFRSAGAKNFQIQKFYKHSVPPGLSDLLRNFCQENKSRRHIES